MQDNIPTLDGYIQSSRQGGLTARDYAQQIGTKTLWCCFVDNENILEGLFIESMHR